MDRRHWLAMAAAGASVGWLAGCSENPVTGRRQLILISDAQLEQMAQQAWADLKAQTPLWRDAGAQRRLSAIGQRVADATGQSNLNWEFVAFDSPQVNAFVLPGGRVGFYRGLLELAGDDGEVAAVMGHEAGHVVARHGAERMSQQLLVDAGVSVATFALSGELGEWADEAAAALGMGVTVGLVMPYSRDHELEADRMGVDLMAKAAYEPQAAVQFWSRMMAASAGRERPLELLSTHPSDDTRIKALQRHIAGLLGQ